MLVKLEWLGYDTVKNIWPYVKPFSSDTGTLRTDGQTDRPTDLLYQYRVSVCWRAIKMDPAQCKCKIIRSSTLGVYRSRWVHRLGPKADGPKLPTVYDAIPSRTWSKVQFQHYGRNGDFFFAFSAHNVTNFPGAPTISNCQFLSIVVFLTANWF